MYVLNRLVKMCLEEDNDIKRILSTYFIRNANVNLSLQKCIDDTGVSKSAIYSFFSEAGFKSFKRFLRDINEEVLLFQYQIKNAHFDYLKDYHFDDYAIKQFISTIKKANHVYFYGNQTELNYFLEIFLYLIQKGYDVKNLNSWNLNRANTLLDDLKQNDVLIIMESHYRLGIYYDQIAIHPNMIDLDKVGEGQYHKYFIGKKDVNDISSFSQFHILSLDKEFDNKNDFGLLLMNKYLMSFIKESED